MKCSPSRESCNEESELDDELLTESILNLNEIISRKRDRKRREREDDPLVTVP